MDSIMDDSVFDITQGSSDFEPEAPKPKGKAAPKITKKAPAKAPKKTAATKMASKLASKKRAKPESDDEDTGADGSMHDDSLLSMTPPSSKKQKKAPGPKKSSGKPLATMENEAVVPDAKGSKGASETYQKLTPVEHVLKRPDTYIGSIERDEKQMWVFNSEKESMELREIGFVPGIYKIFDEILVNAADNKTRDKNMDTIKVTVDREKGEISVQNNGRGIPIEVHEKEKIYIPELIFGHLFSGSNYNDNEQKITGGRNGFGAKLCNVFSTKFMIETCDSRKKQVYKQTWTDNMSKMQKPKITASKSDDYTKVTFYPDFAKFGMTGIDDDLEALIKRRVHDMAGTSKKVKVSLNGTRIKIKNFKEYMDMHLKAIKKERGEEAANDSSTIVTDSDNDRWEVGFAVSDGSFQQVSFVNSIATTSGGTHVNYIADQICNRLMEAFKKKNKGGPVLKPAQIRNHIFVFVNCQIVNPAFTSQTKEQLTTKASQFGSSFSCSDEFFKKVLKTDVLTNIQAFAEKKADQILKKSDGSKKMRVENSKLTDANFAGTAKGYQCVLILTEGDSAKGLAMTGRSIVDPDRFGVFPLRGKLLNVRDATLDQVSKNTEIQNLKNILGLKHKTVYTDCKSLRYGHIMIMTDQDHDGSHIKGLLINFLQVQYPSLLKIPGFLIEFVTPIVKVWKGDPKNPIKSQFFFTLPEYETWREIHGHERGWEPPKYYKGLGTSSDEDAESYFRDIDNHLKEFHTMSENEPELFELAFSKKKADERKEWLRQFRTGTYLDHSATKISYTDFVNKELILFSMADNVRSIPSVVDGMKPGQRKVVYSCLERNLVRDLKVVELAGHIIGKAAYHHGEAALQGTIVNLAQTFVGSNNVNILEPSGNFGSRLQGGQDSASARYIFTRLTPFARRVFHKLDEPILKHNIDDGKSVEPENYVPVVPLLLINGSSGIGTGWSSDIPNYNPEDIVANLKRLMDGEEVVPMDPWFRDFSGPITKIAPGKYEAQGIVRKTSDKEVEITELPVRMWTQDFKDRIVDILKAEKAPSWIKDFDDYNTKQKVRFVVRMDDKYMKIAEEEGFIKRFKLTKGINATNLVAFDAQGRITKYESAEEILKAFYDVRLKFYEKRKAYQLAEWNKDLDKLNNQARFVKEIIDGKLVVSRKRKADLVIELRGRNYTPFPKAASAAKQGETEPSLEDDDDEKNAPAGNNDYDYLLGMAIWSLTKEKVEKLNKLIAAKQDDIDELIKKSKEDLWKKDLDEFLEEWHFQLQDERRRLKNIRQKGARSSLKLNVAAKGKGRKARDDEDSDFEVKKSKKTSKAVGGGILSRLQQPVTSVGASKPAQSAKPKSVASQLQTKLSGYLKTTDGTDSDTDAFLDAAREYAADKSVPASQISASQASVKRESEEPTAPSRTGRTAARKPVNYGLDSDSESGSDGDFDLGNMVKGIGESEALPSRPLFASSASLSRPGSSAGIVAARKSLGRERPSDSEADPDETNYAELARPNKGRPSIGAGKVVSLLEEEDDDESQDLGGAAASAAPPKKAAPARGRAAGGAAAGKAKAAAKPSAKASTAKPPAKKAAKPAPVKEKPVTLSPAAKAYAAKQSKSAGLAKGRSKDVISDDDLEMKDDDEDESVVVSKKSAPAARPSRRAATQRKRIVLDDDDSDEDDSFAMDDSD